MKKLALLNRFVLVCLAAICLSGCYDDQSPFLMENKVDLQSPNGIYEILLFKGAEEALKKIDWSKYKDKQIFYSVPQITNGYLDNVVNSLVHYKFLELGANILYVNRTEDNKDKTDKELKKEQKYDYNIDITVPISGVYYYEGFFKRNYVASVMVNVFAEQIDGTEHNFSSGIIEKKFDKFIPSKTFIVSLWIILLSIVILFLFKKVILNNKNR